MSNINAGWQTIVAFPHCSQANMQWSQKDHSKNLNNSMTSKAHAFSFTAAHIINYTRLQALSHDNNHSFLYKTFDNYMILIVKIIFYRS